MGIEEWLKVLLLAALAVGSAVAATRARRRHDDLRRRMQRDTALKEFKRLRAQSDPRKQRDAASGKPTGSARKSINSAEAPTTNRSS